MIAVLRHVSWLTLLAMGLGLAGCASDAPTSAVESSGEVAGPVVGPRWNLLLLGTSERLDLSPTPYFQIGADGRVSGHDGCNAFKSNVSLGDNQRIEFGQLASTRKACPDMQDARRVTEMLDSAYRYLIDHDRLVFFGPDQRVLGGFQRVD
ncbi:META domain-containing protein [Halomonas sabkhae]|uniref:META domain-containing protein n=1 Tax=Halomonas sabkhae TaxID=626223 RepID=UPI0025B50243|nr:META domain-containing protein [Halomonas sabkhae]MDN3524473.1 META domain-containing protein [Halomonas sabkhae]